MHQQRAVLWWGHGSQGVGGRNQGSTTQRLHEYKLEVAGGDVDNDDVDHFDDDGDCVDYEDYNVYSTIYKWCVPT